MSKRWTLKDDKFLVSFSDLGADRIASHDLGFHSKNAGTNRVKKLKELGVWDKIVAADRATTLAHLHWNLAFSVGEAQVIAYHELIKMGEIVAADAPVEAAE